MAIALPIFQYLPLKNLGEHGYKTQNRGFVPHFSSKDDINHRHFVLIIVPQHLPNLSLFWSVVAPWTTSTYNNSPWEQPREWEQLIYLQQ